MSIDAMTQFCIYRSPADYQGKFVVRRWRIIPSSTQGVATIQPDVDPLFVGDTIEAARNALPLGLFRLDRDPQDDSCIAEVWL